MKVLELCLSTGVGGLELYAVRSATQLILRGVGCLAVVANKTMTAERMAAAGVRTLPINRINKFIPLVAAYKLAKIITNNNIDIVHMHWGKDLSLAVVAKILARIRFGTTFKLVYTRQMMLTRPKKDFYHRFLYRHVDLFITITKELKKLALAYLPMPEKSIQVLYYGVDSPQPLSIEEKEALRQRLGNNTQQFAVAIVGRIEQGKGQHLVIDAVKRLMHEGINIHATLIGPVMDETYYQSIQQGVRSDNLKDNICFYGSHDNPIDIMSVFDCVILASGKETFGLVLIEAMRNGVAVIGSNAGGVPEVIENGVTGLLFVPKDPEDLARQIAKLYHDPRYRAQIAKQGKRYADKQFDQGAHYASLKEKMRNCI